jgi:hypothetical protein
MNEHEWEPIIDENHMLRPMCDQVRMRASGGVFGDWQVVPEPARTVAAWRKARMAHEYEFRRRVAAKPSDGDEWITDPSVTIQRGDLYRVREDSHHDYCEWRSADHYEGTEAGYFAAFHSRDIQFCRPVRPAAQPVSEPEWEPLPLQDDTILQPGRDEARFRAGCGEWSAWVPLSGGPLSLTAFIAERPSHFVYEFRRRTELQPAPEQPPAPAPDRGSKYHRTITQTLCGDTCGCSVTIDVYDVLQAFGVTCPALQHGIKKLLCAGLRGGKSAEQDIEEAILSCRRAIELLEFGL